MARSKRSAAPDGLSLAKEDERKRFLALKSWFTMEHARQEVNRFQMALDCDYKDGVQWRPDEAAAVRKRGQNPIVFNEIKPAIDWLIGTERRLRRDFKVLARTTNTPEAGQDAEVKTKLLKYIADVNRSPFERSLAFEEQVTAGLGWLEVGIGNDPEDEMIYLRHESWRWMLHDSLGYRRDLSDARYVFRFKEIDLDIAQAFFPDKHEELARAANMGDVAQWDDEWSGAWPTSHGIGGADMPARFINFNPENHLFNPRQRVSLVECWHLYPSTETTGQGAGSQDRVKMKMRVAIMTRQDMLLETWSPYRHNRYPFIPMWCYRSKRDGMPFGVVRNLRGPQDDLNKRMSKSQFLLSANQLRVEVGAIDKAAMSIETIRDEIASPDGIAIFADGALSANRVQIREHGDIAQGHLALADRDAAAIRSVSGVTMENRGGSTGQQSGKAIIAKQDQGSMVTAEVFDSMLFSHQLEGELMLSLIEQFYTEEKVFSVTGERYKLDYTTINAKHPVTGEKTNDVTRHKAAFVIGEAPWKQAMAEAAFESAMNMLGALAPVAPQVVTAIIDLVFEWSDLPNKQAILQRIRQATGMSDPDDGETPEQQANKAQQAAMQKEQFDAQVALLQASVREAQAKGEKLETEAMAKRLESLYVAAQGAAALAMQPGITPIADELLKSAGFQDRNAPATLDPMASGQPVTPEPSAPEQQAQQQMIPEPMQADGALMGAKQGIGMQDAGPPADGIGQLQP